MKSAYQINSFSFYATAEISTTANKVKSPALVKQIIKSLVLFM
jgi:hypothetical protein